MNKQLLRSLLKSNAHLVINKTLMEKISLEAAILMADLISKEEYFDQNNMLDEDGFFFNTRENITKDTTLSAYQQRVAIKKLIENKILEIREQGQKDKSCRTFYKIDYNRVVKYLTTHKPSSRGVVKYLTPSSEKTAHLVVKKLHSNNIIYNNIYNNNNIRKVSEINKKLIKQYNEIFGTRFKTDEGWYKNAEHWLTIYSEDEVVQAIKNIEEDKFWKDKMDLSILFRRKNPQGEAVDYISKMLNGVKKNKKIKTFMIGGKL